ncbi:MAG: bifunctional diaminohydroxyphosphoribosylaminopyrimidine deaminase/5-amino-6-(5-phosphoribosylamino)uracil reductase RibD [Gammaproteobacteria bacterium]|nr:bifunctional diaminohydroxyphosphoribosylaminopyrimidine deaminase/5-amino-6-(5-phosphoribosylamino)uracil reductase RibD [Gammaproteobacteria bacterium]
MQNTRFMASAMRYARRGVYTTSPNPNVGCVIVKDNQEVAVGWHQKTGQAHAEINALERAGELAQGATAYVTLEPCCHQGKTGPCADALITAGISTVYIAMQDPNPLVAGQGIKRLRDAGVEVHVGLLESRARLLNQGFIKRMQQGMPFVRLKMAMSLDGRTAMASGESRWVTGADARQDVQRMRARSSAILTGIDTVLADDPSLNVRLDSDALGVVGETRQPLRVILDTRGRLPADAKLLKLEGQVLLLTADKTKLFEHPNLIVEEVGIKQGRLDLREVMHILAQYEVNELHVEAGSVLSGALLNENLADEIVVYMASHLMGNDAQGLFTLPDIETMQQRINLKIEDIRAVGKDWRITAKPVITDTLNNDRLEQM